ncbi:VacJ family lipoprotein [Candidatus Pelagibacter bacterium]|jgi:phospholipid-binding lipoprotein MlaA|nr:VacJ family lipoprotein [Candidatus Pelagibacter bacterium]|tara:strand:- start:553 stop:1302 length:750 start_codon:yes stop_codon:yes gene_type:complete
MDFQIQKNIKLILPILLLITFVSPKTKATEECFEGVSRTIFKFNMAFDGVILEPVAKSYNKLPEPIKNGTSNFTSNIATLLSIPNSLLQGNLKQVGHSTGSFLINSTVGILGFLNPAEKIGLKPHKEDVGQTLGAYGVGPGCYLVLPILGPSTARDAFGLFADSFVDPFAHITIRDNEILGISGNDLDYYTVKGTTAVDFRADQDANFESLEKNSLDFYSALKSVYLQDRENKIKNSTDGQDELENLDN